MVLGGLILGVIAIFLPPLAVVIRRGCGADILINILLCFLAWIPGVLHAWYIIIKTPSHSTRRKEDRRAHAVRAHPPPPAHHHHHHPPPQYPHQTTGHTYREKY